MHHSSLYSKYFSFLNEDQLTKYKDFKDTFSGWNEKINLISRRDMQNFEIHHVLHSLAISNLIWFKDGSRVLDLGTGGGFPGIPLAIMFPGTEFVLLDSIAKKINAVANMAGQLDLSNVKTVCERVEKLDETFDFTICRAVGSIDKVLPWIRKKITSIGFNDLPNGFIFLKGGDLDAELSSLDIAFRRMDLKKYYSEPFFETKEIVYLSEYL